MINKGIDLLITSSKTLVESSEYNDFWVLSLSRDNSFEEGSRSAPQKRLVKRFEKAGISAYLATQMKLGINGNLASIMQRCLPAAKVIRNQVEGSDLIVTDRELGHIEIESKLVYEETTSNYFNKIKNDYTVKLGRLRQQRSDSSLLLVVFFVECPSLDYPEGRWIDLEKISLRRKVNRRNRDIASRFEVVKAAIGRTPTWPLDSLFTKNLQPPIDPQARDSMVSLYKEQFITSSSWIFDPVESFSAARVGFAIWEYPQP